MRHAKIRRVLALAGLVGWIAACAHLENSATPAAAQLEERFFDRDYPAGYVEGKAAMLRHPDDDAIAAWFAANAARSGHLDEAVAVADARIARDASSGWARFAKAVALLYEPKRAPECLDAAATAYALDPAREDFIWIYAEALRLQRDFAAGEALLKKHQGLVERTSNLLVVRASIALDQALRDRKKTALSQAGYDDLRAAERIDPSSAHPHIVHAFFLTADGWVDESFDHLQAAVRTSDALSIRQNYWGAALRRSTVDVEASKALVREDIDRLLQSRPQDPDALFAASGGLGMIGDAEGSRKLSEQVLALNVPGRALDQVKFQSFMDRSVQLVYAKPGQPGSADDIRALEEEVVAFLAAPGVEPGMALMTTQSLLMLVEHSPEPSPRSIDALTTLFMKHGDDEPYLAYRAYPKLLADKGRNLADAETLILKGKASFDDMSRRAEQDGERQAARNALGELDETLGWVWFKQGKLEAAERQLSLSAKNPPAMNPVVYSHLAALYVERGDLATAMLYLERCFSAQWNEESPCAVNLAAYYRKKYPGEKDEPTWVAAKVKELQGGKAAALADRYQRSRTKLKPFALATLDGGKINSAQLRGKILVVSFWGAWCGACMVELPELQAFATKHAGVDDLVFLTINNDTNVNDARKAKTEKDLRFLIALDDGYAKSAGVYSFPTTWVIGPDHDRRLELRGLTPNLGHELESMVAAVRGR